MTTPKFIPLPPLPPTLPKQIRINRQDWEAIERAASELDVYPSEIVRQAVSFAIKHMDL